MQTSPVASVPIPDLQSFTFHKVLYDVEFGGAAIPGLIGAYYRTTLGDRKESVGIYMVNGVELFRAWGFVDDEHCSYHTIALPGGGVVGPFVGCPNIEVRREGEQVRELTVHTGTDAFRYAVGAPTAWESVGGGLSDRFGGLALGEAADVPQ
ncbi:hypothetical protein [Stackebrandtia soli]|uniref:hypothetical protein n=1 Tax=Stackebrandtia soli TaxID=1892856 RepID=UPI0039E953DA